MSRYRAKRSRAASRLRLRAIAPPPALEQTDNYKALAATGPMPWPPRVWLSPAARERRSFQGGTR